MEEQAAPDEILGSLLEKEDFWVYDPFLCVTHM
jgi:hypothetical protein